MLLDRVFSDRALARISSVLPDVAVKAYGRYQSALYGVSGGRLGGRYGRGPVLRLTTTGRRSGEARSTVLLYGRDGNRLVLVGSNRGSDHHPAWVLNLLADPEAEVQIGRERSRVFAREVTGDERARLWPLMSEIYEGFDVYDTLTDRDLKVFVLAPPTPGTGATSTWEPGAVMRALDELADELGADGSELGAQAARRALERSEW